MKLGLLGDIHGNHRALRAVLNAAKAENVERLLITGDFVGYYFDPAKVLELLNEWDYIAVRGNHEEMLCAVRHNPATLASVTTRYGCGTKVALEQLDSGQLDELCNLPHPLLLELDGLGVLLSHGSPWDLNRYVYPDADPSLFMRCAAEGHDLVVMGHTHHPMRKDLEKTTLVNPGSVGQPRDRNPSAAWALFDTSTRQLTFRRERYDQRMLIAECLCRHPELPYLAEVLERKQ